VEVGAFYQLFISGWTAEVKELCTQDRSCQASPYPNGNHIFNPANAQGNANLPFVVHRKRLFPNLFFLAAAMFGFR
jgi:hypothetical protein